MGSIRQLTHQGRGSVQVVKLTVDPETGVEEKETVVNVLAAGASFGALGVVSKRPRGATVKAITECEVFVIHAYNFVRCVDLLLLRSLKKQVAEMHYAMEMGVKLEDRARRDANLQSLLAGRSWGQRDQASGGSESAGKAFMPPVTFRPVKVLRTKSDKQVAVEVAQKAALAAGLIQPLDDEDAEEKTQHSPSLGGGRLVKEPIVNRPMPTTPTRPRPQTARHTGSTHRRVLDTTAATGQQIEDSRGGQLSVAIAVAPAKLVVIGSSHRPTAPGQAGGQRTARSAVAGPGLEWETGVGARIATQLRLWSIATSPSSPPAVEHRRAAGSPTFGGSSAMVGSGAMVDQLRRPDQTRRPATAGAGTLAGRGVSDNGHSPIRGSGALLRPATAGPSTGGRGRIADPPARDAIVSSIGRPSARVWDGFGVGRELAAWSPTASYGGDAETLRGSVEPDHNWVTTTLPCAP